MPGSIKLNTKGLQQKLQQGGPKAFRYLSQTTQYWAVTIEMTARHDARWTDQTGNARNGLTGQAVISGSYNSHAQFAIVLYHKVEYGIWLETRHFSHKGDLGIIQPTLDKSRQQYFQAVDNLFARMF